MTFEEILKELRNGKVVRRQCWRNGIVVFMQIPAEMSCAQTWSMHSLPGDMKVFLKQQGAGITYKDQFITYDLMDRVATYMLFDGECLNAIDWEVIDPFKYSVWYE